MARDRIVTGLALTTVVVEANARSGSVNAGDRARRQGRLLFAAPGSPGTDGLIAEGAEPMVPEELDMDAAAVDTVTETAGDEGLYALINNAGIVIPGPLKYTTLDEFREHFEVNLFGLLDVTQQFLPLLGASADSPYPPGRIINISSTSGRVAYPFMGAYASTKHALEALSDSLRRELMLYGVDVIVIQPGTTNTPIKQKFARQVGKYEETDYGPMFIGLEEQMAEREKTGLPVEKVVEAIVTAVESQHPKTRYAVPRKWLTSWIIPRLLPDRWLDRFVDRQLGISNKDE